MQLEWKDKTAEENHKGYKNKNVLFYGMLISCLNLKIHSFMKYKRNIEYKVGVELKTLVQSSCLMHCLCILLEGWICLKLTKDEIEFCSCWINNHIGWIFSCQWHKKCSLYGKQLSIRFDISKLPIFKKFKNIYCGCVDLPKTNQSRLSSAWQNYKKSHITFKWC